MKRQSKSVYLSFPHALAWIVGSTLIISGGGFALFKESLKFRQRAALDPQFAIRSIIQTGPQKEALKTEYLAEWLGISSDRPPSSQSFNLQQAKERLMQSPLIAQADVQLISPNTLYIDYTVRQPIAWLEDYDNVVIDKEGYLFPFRPFFSPKNLPSIYMGLAPFGVPPSDGERPIAQWGVPLKGKYIDIAFDILKLVTDVKVADLFCIKRIDVSNAFAESCGKREIVIMTEDLMIRNMQGKEVQFCFPRILRLSPKNYPQELSNYLKLRQQLLEEEKKINLTREEMTPLVRLQETIIDFRLPNLAFIEEQKK